ncbi:MAG: Uma2 family endonuclease, partial [Cyanobacteria bacterium]|nr:Uma2 family endonuclease [Cyanobacteriota bacterium]
MTAQEYLEFEETASIRHEYVHGKVFSMTGATEAHNLICGNLFALLHAYLSGTGCRVFMVDMKVRVEAADCFYYPDIMVTCEPFDGKSVYKSLPRLIIEVLSPSTRQIDRREKLVAYQQISTLRQYVLVHQNNQRVEVHRMKADDQWEFFILGKDDQLVLEALHDSSLTLPVSAV